MLRPSASRRNRFSGLRHQKTSGVKSGNDNAVAGEVAPGHPPGTVPRWGQLGDFIINVRSVPIRIEQDGILGIGAGTGTLLGFETHAVDYNRPFMSNTDTAALSGYTETCPLA